MASFIEELLEDKPDGFYYVHGRPPASHGRLHGLYCVPIAKLYKQGDSYDWEYRYTYKTKKYPLKKKKRVWRLPRHRKRLYLLHDKRIFPD